MATTQLTPIDRQLLERVLADSGRIRALVVGDLMLDEYLFGKAERISPEAPVQVVDVQKDDLRLGGAGNVINNLVTLGCRVEVASVLGDDSDGALLRASLQRQGISVDGIVLQTGRVTSRKTRVIASNQQVLRIDRESRDAVSPAAEAELLQRIEAAMGRCDVILVSDYLKGVLTPTVLAAIIGGAKARGVAVVVDPKGDDYGKYRGATLLTPNRKEAQIASGIAIRDEASLAAAGEKLCVGLDLQALLITRSEEGMSLFYHEGRAVHLPTEAREVFDVSGAGDTVLALVGIGLAAGLEFAMAARIANVAAGIVVGKVGTSTVTADELVESAGRQHADSDFKIKSRAALALILEKERRAGRRIVFTNGCFDLLHVGHVKYLQQARRLGDLLVLGLNSDASIRRLKGEKRPLIGEAERGHVLAALDCIDYVVVFDEDTPLELIAALRPQILVKGGDYTPDTVVGKELVESWGGRVELIPFVEGKSTTRTIEKILEQYK